MTPELVLNQDLFYIFATIIATTIAAYKQRQASSARKQTAAVIDYLDPAKPDAATPPKEVADRFGTEIPTIAADGLTVGDLEVIGLFSEWKRYDPQHQIPLKTLGRGDKISVPFRGRRAGNAYVGLKVDGQVYDTKHTNIRSDMLGHPLEIWFTMPRTITSGEHLVSVVEGYKTNTMSYDIDPCWFDESMTYTVEVR